MTTKGRLVDVPMNFDCFKCPYVSQKHQGDSIMQESSMEDTPERGIPQRVLVLGKVWPERSSSAAGVRTGDLVSEQYPQNILNSKWQMTVA